MIRKFNSNGSSLSESVNSYYQFDFIYDTNFFTQNLETFSCVAFLSDGNRIMKPQKIFLIPYFLKAPFAVTYCYAVCVIGGISSLEELFIHLTAGSYNSKKKSLLNIKSHNSEIA